MKKFLALFLVAVMTLGCMTMFASCGDNTDGKGMTESPLPAPEIKGTVEIPAEFKIGFIFLHDENSTYDANFINAANAVKKALNLSDDQVIMKKNIAESDDCYNAAIELADKGCKVVFADSFGHESFMLQAAQARPDTEFCHATGTLAHTAGVPNYHNAFANIYEGRYLAGIVAGLKLNEMIENGTITADKAVMGYVGAFTYAEVISGLTSTYLGAKSVCPSVTMKVQFTGSWYAEDLEQEAATALINAGAVLMSQHADSMGAPSACEIAGVPDVSYNGSTFDACPETFLVSSAINWAPYFQLIIESAVKGEAIPADWCGGIKEGSVVLSGINEDAAAEGSLKAVEDAIAEFKAGTLHVFDTSKDNFITVNGQKLTTYMADVNTDANYEKDTEAIKNGYFAESEYRSAPYFDLTIDGIEFLNSKF
ncbi:MAG: BMP family ABC transporter substrate-binding protein [Clostridia bacterium]|nr:BMP family ABC transporter substrate-binding protein [Clostridia bacterium]